MMPFTKRIPKALVKIGKITLLENCILRLKDFGVEEIVINTHHMSNEIENYVKSKGGNLTGFRMTGFVCHMVNSLTV